jgi:LAS superfamily LD-carboxypeptidase LdcB
VQFTDKNYIPANLIDIKGDYLILKKPAKLRKEALDSLVELSKAFYEAFSKPIIIVSAFRDYKYQV